MMRYYGPLSREALRFIGSGASSVFLPDFLFSAACGNAKRPQKLRWSAPVANASYTLYFHFDPTCLEAFGYGWKILKTEVNGETRNINNDMEYFTVTWGEMWISIIITSSLLRIIEMYPLPLNWNISQKSSAECHCSEMQGRVTLTTEGREGGFPWTAEPVLCGPELRKVTHYVD